MNGLSFSAILVSNPWSDALGDLALRELLAETASAGAAWLRARQMDGSNYGWVMLDPTQGSRYSAGPSLVARLTYGPQGGDQLLPAASKAEQHWRHDQPSRMLTQDLHLIGDGYADVGSTSYRGVVGAGHGVGSDSTDLAHYLLKLVVDEVHLQLQAAYGHGWLNREQQPGDAALRLLAQPPLPN